MRPAIVIWSLLLAVQSASRAAPPVLPSEMARADALLEAALGAGRPRSAPSTAPAAPGDVGSAGRLPFSFSYKGRRSTEVLEQWERTDEARPIDGHRVRRTVTWTDPGTRLQVRCEAVRYDDFPTVEWTLYFRNTGDKDTPIASDVQALELSLERPPSSTEFLLHHWDGSQANSDDYRPHVMPLPPKAQRTFAPQGGWPSSGTWPYFNLEWGGAEHEQQGALIAIGWPGQWAAHFTRNDGSGLHLRAGQELTHFKLQPGEEVRSPLIALQFYQGDWVRAQNIWRRWMLAHNLPRLAGGALPPPLLAGGSSNQTSEMQKADAQNQKQFIDGYLRHGITLDFWWMDAGWYLFKDGWPNVGTWEVDTRRFPKGLREVSDFAHEKGLKTLLWFEPERVTPGTWLYEHHREWLLGADGQTKLLYLGNPDARQWVVDHVDEVMGKQGIDIYRQDFNFPPLHYWREHDAPDRQGITEIKHVNGYLAWWDELLRRHPGMLLDTCASGGRRNDLETLRRAVPLHKSDMQYPNLTAKQTQLYGLAFWAPYFGAPVYPAERVDVYGFRCGMAPLTGLGYDTRRDNLDYKLLAKLVEQRRQIVANYFGDYYPLTPWSAEPGDWIAWQFDRPEEGRGMVQAFRRPESVYEAARLKLLGLDAAATYRLTDFDDERTREVGGAELMSEGLEVVLPHAPQAAVISYRRAR